MAYGTLFVAWVIYFVVHSALASSSLKSKLGHPTWYRAFYSIVAVLGLIPIFILFIQFPSKQLFQTSMTTKLPALALGYTAYFVFRQAFKLYDLGVFLGASQPKSGDGQLLTSGILSRMRHPIYCGTILISAGFWLWSPTDLNLVMIVSWYLYLPVGIWLEEKKLIAEFGEAYLAYRKQVPAIFPKLMKKMN